MNSVKRLVLLANCSAIIIIVKYIFLFIPNVEMVTFLLIIFTLVFTFQEALLISLVYTIVEAAIWGLTEQAYIWTLIVILTFLLKNVFKENFILWALFSGFMGLIFGFLSSIPFLILIDYTYAFSYFMLGLVFDVIHMVSNYLIMLLLGQLVYNLLKKLMITFNRRSL